METAENELLRMTWSFQVAKLVAEDLLKSDILNPYQLSQARQLIARNLLAHLGP